MCGMQTGIYSLIQLIQFSSLNLPALPADDYIPFIPFFVVPYVLFYAYLPSVPVYISGKNAHDFKKYVIVWAAVLSVCSIAHIVYPTYVIRAEVTGNGFFDRLVSLVYSIDGTTNCLPSVHCATAWLCFIGLRGRREVKMPVKAASFLFSALVCLSTVFIKQHWILDVITAVAVSELFWAAAGKCIRFFSENSSGA